MERSLLCDHELRYLEDTRRVSQQQRARQAEAKRAPTQAVRTAGTPAISSGQGTTGDVPTAKGKSGKMAAKGQLASEKGQLAGEKGQGPGDKGQGRELALVGSEKTPTARAAKKAKSELGVTGALGQASDMREARKVLLAVDDEIAWEDERKHFRPALAITRIAHLIFAAIHSMFGSSILPKYANKRL